MNEQEKIDYFFQGYTYAMSLLSQNGDNADIRPDCKTAWQIQNKERMTLRLYEQTHPLLQKEA